MIHSVFSVNSMWVCWFLDSHSGDYEEYYFWEMTQFSLVVCRHFGGRYSLQNRALLNPYFLLLTSLAYSSSMKKEAVHYVEK
jgi:hypothetical protein